MALSPEELARRVRAARAYAGFDTQPELGELMKADGLGVTDPGRLERPSGKKKPPPLTQARLDSLVKHTGLPAAWFTEELGLSEPAKDPAIEELRRAVAALATLATTPDLGPAARQLLEAELAAARQWSTSIPPTGEPGSGAGNG
jgi:hypothetical protein